MKLKKPELKTPELKAPPFLADLYLDLRERRLLPLVALLVVAIAAVPFLLGSEAEKIAVPAAEEPPATAGAAPDPASLTVVEAKPGLRDYRKRLRGRTPMNPFKQQYTSVPKEAQLSSVDVSSSGEGDGSTNGGGSTEATETEVDVTVDSGSEGSGGQGQSGNGGSTGGGKTQVPTSGLYGFRPDVRFGIAGSDDLTLYRELSVGSFLPKKNPVLIFLGVTQDGERALFDVSPEVVLVRGDANCVGGKRSCAILSLREGQAVTLVTKSPNRTFRAAVDRIQFVEIHLPKNKGSSSAIEPRAAGLSVVGQFERRQR